VATVALWRSLGAGSTTSLGPTSNIEPQTETRFSPEANEALRVVIEEIGRKPTLSTADALYLEAVGEGLPENERLRVRMWVFTLFATYIRQPLDDETFEVVHRATLRTLSDPAWQLRFVATALCRDERLRDLPTIRAEGARLVHDPEGMVRELAPTVWPDLAPPGSVPEPPQ
jgi:hypothetical protein